jgi:hypothetical protein
VEASVLDRVARRGVDEPLSEWAERLERRQAAIARAHLDLLRLLEGRPVRGFVVASLNEPLGAPPAAGDALVDAEGGLRRAFWALQEACRPVTPVARLAPPSRRTDPARSGIEVWVANRLGTAIREASVVLCATTASERTERVELRGSVDAGAVTWVGAVTLATPSPDDPLERLEVSLVPGPRSPALTRAVVSHYDADTLAVAEVPGELDRRDTSR